MPFLEGIHKAQFAKLPNNFKNLDRAAIDEILKNPKGNPNLPKQEPGIKPANAIPYELYAHAGLDPAGKQLKIDFTAGTKFFGEKAKGAGFIVYSGDKNWDFTVDAGDTIDYHWPLADFSKGTYDLKVYSANGFYRRYIGNANDPEIGISLKYQAEKDGSKPNGNVMLHIRRLAKGNPIKIAIKDNSYKKPVINTVLNKSQEEIFIPIELKASHNWYDFTVTTDKNQTYSQQFAGHVEHSKDSFTDPLMGNLHTS